MANLYVDGILCTDEEYRNRVVANNTTAIEKSEWKELLTRIQTDINWLLVEGFDTNIDDCTIEGIRETIAEIRKFDNHL